MCKFINTTKLLCILKMKTIKAFVTKVLVLVLTDPKQIVMVLMDPKRTKRVKRLIVFSNLSKKIKLKLIPTKN